MRRLTPGRVALFAALPFLLGGPLAEAASFKVAPVRVTMEVQQRSDVVTLTNSGSEDVSVQADPFLWTQDESGADVYDDTDELLIVPRIFSIPPGAAQVIRIGRMKPADPSRQRAYRVFFTELAPPAEPGESPGLRFRLRLGIPVFMNPETPAEPALELIRSGHVADGFEVVLKNTGLTHVQLLSFNSARIVGKGAHDITHPVGIYLLPNVTQRFVVPIPSDIRVATFTVETDVAVTLEYAARPRN